MNVTKKQSIFDAGTLMNEVTYWRLQKDGWIYKIEDGVVFYKSKADVDWVGSFASVAEIKCEMKQISEEEVMLKML